jgi:chemotaxis protein methyltransferase CheR
MAEPGGAALTGRASTALMALSGDDPLQPDVEAVEFELLLEGIYRQYGFDFRDYAPSSLRRRVRQRMQAEGLRTISALQERVLHDPACMERLLRDLSIHVTSLFRDPTFYLTFRVKVVPLLRTYPFIRIWNAGCSTGEEAWSMAILLEEEGLGDRTRIYATDVNENVLETARSRHVPVRKLREYEQHYKRGGGRHELSRYLAQTDGDHVAFAASLGENIHFAQHNLVSDRSFNEFHAVLCRNVLIYFGRRLQDEVHGLLHESLVTFGVLALGRRESIRFTRVEQCYAELDAREKLYRKVH